MKLYEQKFVIKKESKLFEQGDIPLSPAIQKIIQVFHMKRRSNERRTFYEVYGAGDYDDDHHIRKIAPDFKLVDKLTTGFAWTGYSKKELFQIDYVERDIYLIVFRDMNELNKSIRSSIEWAKRNR